MENVITNTKIRFISETKTYIEENPFEPFSSNPKEDYALKEVEKKEDIKKITDLTTEEGYKKFIDELFRNRVFIANENWEKTINVNSKILYSNKDSVICECLVDKENNIFEKMSFPRHLFNHIDNLKTTPYVILSIQSKIGSTRIDIIKGADLVDKKAFELKEEWEKLDGKDFNQPLDKPLEL